MLGSCCLIAVVTKSQLLAPAHRTLAEPHCSLPAPKTSLQLRIQPPAVEKLHSMHSMVAAAA